MEVRHLLSFLLTAFAIIMTTKATKIVESFPIQTFTKLSTNIAPPTYATLRIAQTELNSNATSIGSHGGDGELGHLALTITPAAYIALSEGGVPFVPPVNPGAVPIHAAGATGPQIAETNRQFKEDQATFRLYKEVDHALRNQLIAACHPTYIRALSHDTLGFGKVTCLQLLTHLWKSYGVIKQDELNENYARMNTAWNPPTPIEDLFTQLEEGEKFATAGREDISPVAIVRMAYNLIEATGLFDLPCRDWRNKTDAEKTMDNFKDFFQKAEFDRRRNITSQSAGFHGAHKATVTTPKAVAPVTTVAPTTSTSYCWTHGTSKNAKHTSSTCENKAEGHQDDATSTDKKGGSTKIWGPKK